MSMDMREHRPTLASVYILHCICMLYVTALVGSILGCFIVVFLVFADGYGVCGWQQRCVASSGELIMALASYAARTPAGTPYLEGPWLQMSNADLL